MIIFTYHGPCSWPNIRCRGCNQIINFGESIYHAGGGGSYHDVCRPVEYKVYLRSPDKENPGWSNLPKEKSVKKQRKPSPPLKDKRIVLLNDLIRLRTVTTQMADRVEFWGRQNGHLSDFERELEDFALMAHSISVLMEAMRERSLPPPRKDKTSSLNTNGKRPLEFD